ncbi:MAG: amidohydrolase family protein [Novosphingobium sp.]|nr:amidohydrolase family protein [Novosphingobium sp.]
MRIIDVDSHFNEPADWFAKANPALAAKLPKMTVAEQLIDVLVGDLFSSVPPAMRPDPMTLLPAVVVEAYEKSLEGGDPPQIAIDAGAYSPEAYEPAPRLAWMDKRGIDKQIVLPSNGYHPYRHAMRNDPSLALPALETYNNWALDQLAGYTERLIPVVVVDLMDVQWSLKQIMEGRKRGARAAFVKADPHGDKSLDHPDFEPFWATCEDIGMAVMFHVGGGRAAMHPGWANNGGNMAAFYRQASLARRLVPQLALGAMIFGGVLERYPNLAIVVSELGIDWLPDFLEAADAEADNSRPRMLSFAPYNLTLKPSEFMQRQVIVSVVHQQDRLHPTIDRVPEGMIVFSSDFPHIEGHQEAVAIYDKQCEGLSQSAREAFFGTSAARLLGI